MTVLNDNTAFEPHELSALSCNRRFEQAAGEAPVLVTSAAIRPFVRSLVERFRSQTTVLSQAKSIRGRG